jgi:hypothetical protein
MTTPPTEHHDPEHNDPEHNDRARRPVSTPASTSDHPSALDDPGKAMREIDVENALAGVMVGHRMAGGTPDEIDLDLVRRVITRELTGDEAVAIIKHRMGIPTETPAPSDPADPVS